MTINKGWNAYLWVDSIVDPPTSSVIVLDWKRLNDTHPFVNHDLILAESNLAGKSDYLRMEVVYRYGGIYFDTDTVAVYPLDAYGNVFRWPVVSWIKGYNNVYVIRFI